MADIRSCDAKATLVFWPTANAGTVGFDLVEVVGERGVAEVEGAGRGDGVTKALVKIWISERRDVYQGRFDAQQFSLAKRSRTCLLPGRQKRPSLRDIRRPSHSVVCSVAASPCRH